MDKVESFARTFRKSHRALAADIEKIELALKASQEQAQKPLCAALEATQHCLKRHIRLEETDGYMSEVLEREPRLERQVRELEADHLQLRRSVEKLLEEARAPLQPDAALKDRIRKWIKHLRQHGEKETDLVQEAFNRDLSGED